MKTPSLLLLGTSMMLACSNTGQTTQYPTTQTEIKPTTIQPEGNSSVKLVIGITVDQMRYEYLMRYWNDFSEGGFKRLVNEGFSFNNHHFGYVPTFTGPGHASIFTGTTPAHHGIIANDWYDRKAGKMVYCASAPDPEVKGVGTENSGGNMSPQRMVAGTIGDQLRIFSNMRSKVFGISMKDRGAILPAGHTPNAAYWFIGKGEGNWVSSSYYMNELPQWVVAFNQKRLPDSYLDKGWDLMLSAEAYDESLEDVNPFESPYSGTARAAFPYDLRSLMEKNGQYELFKSTPWGNTLTIDFARELIRAEGLGTDQFTDVLAMSFSCTDYAGHQFGPHARETQDVYLRLDRDLASFIDYLDQTFGRDSYLIFLSADHGGANVPSHMEKLNIPAGYFRNGAISDFLEEAMDTEYGAGDYIENVSNEQVFLKHSTLTSKKVDLEKACAFLSRKALEFEGVYTAVPGTNFRLNEYTEGMLSRIQDGYYPTRSGDVIIVFEPGWMDYGKTGTTHGSGYTEDTHIPLLFFGAGIPSGESYRPSRIRDIAPTVAAIIKAPLPNACTGEPLREILKK